MYTYSSGDNASIILRTESCEKTIKSLGQINMKLVKAEEIYDK